PGSMPVAREIYEEGFRAPPVLLERGGAPQRDVLVLLLANVRTPEERRADLAAQLGAQRTGVARLGDLARRRGRKPLAAAAAHLIDYAERCVRAALAGLPRGRFRFEEFPDDDGLGSGPLRTAVPVPLGDDRARAVLERSSPQCRGPSH